MLNKATIMGRVGRDPEIKTMQTGAKMASFSIATSEKWKDKNSGEQRERTEWHNVVIWNEMLVGVAEKYVKKGDLLYLEGQIETRKWEKDGVDRYSTEIVLRPFHGELKLMPTGTGNGDGKDDDRGRDEGRGSGGGKSGGGGESQQQQSAVDDLDDEIPF